MAAKGRFALMSWGRTFNIVQVLLGVGVILVAELVRQHLRTDLVVTLAVAILVLGVGRELWDQYREKAALAELDQELAASPWMLVTGPQG
jgi:hypothetical protein